MRAARIFFLVLGMFALMLLLTAIVLIWAKMDLTVSAPGTIEAAVAAQITPRIEGVVSEIHKSVGDAVLKGDTIARLDDAAARQRFKKAQAALEEARKRNDALELGSHRILERIRILEIRLRELESDRGRARENLKALDALVSRRNAELAEREKAVEQAHIQHRKTQRSLEEYRQLLASRLVSETRVKDAETAVQLAAIETEKAKDRVQALVAEAARTRSMRDEARLALEAVTETSIRGDMKEAEFDLQGVDAGLREQKALLDRMAADVRLAELNLKEHLITAPIEGRIETLFLAEGERPGVDASGVARDSSGLVVQDAGFLFVAEVASRDLTKVGIAQAAEVMLDAYPYRRYGIFRGTVTELERLKENPEAYRVTIELGKPVYPIRPGMRGYAKIIVDRASVFSYLMGLAESEEVKDMREKADEFGWATYPEKPGEAPEPAAEETTPQPAPTQAD